MSNARRSDRLELRRQIQPPVNWQEVIGGRAPARGRGHGRRGAARGRGSQSTARSSADSSYRHSQQTLTTVETELDDEEEYQDEEEARYAGEPSVNNDSRHSGSRHIELPPPPGIDIATMLVNQNRLIEELAHIDQNNQNNRGFAQGKMSDFLRTRPPTFDRADDPLEADSWIRTISQKLDVVNCVGRERVNLAAHQLVGAAAEWWENFCEGVPNP